MLSDENKKKIQAALKTMEELIKYLDGAPFDPRVITLIDVAASYLDEQHENAIEYPDEQQHVDDIPQDAEVENTENVYGGIEVQSAEEYMKELDKAFSIGENFKFLPPTKKLPKLEDTPSTKIDGDSIAEEIQKWYQSGMPDNPNN